MDTPPFRPRCAGLRRHRGALAAHASALIVLICVWAVCRSDTYRVFQAPPRPLMHANYVTFHEMSVRLDEGASLGNINLTRMTRHAWDRPYDPYETRTPPQSTYCDYYTLDVGFALIVHAARHIFVTLPDNFLRTLALQGVVDLFALIAIYALLHYWGWIPALMGGLLFAVDPVLSYVVALTFYYFWDGVLTVAVLGTLIAGTAHVRRRRSRRSGQMLLIAMGVLLGFGVLLRASWFPYALILLGTLVLFKDTRRHSWKVAAAFLIAASPAIMRASIAEGRPATSTRMAWHTAHQALGKFPNALGLEDDDGYQFELAEHKYGVPYTFCSYRKQDEAMRTDYRAVFEQDPGFVARSVLTRVYENVFWNANENYHPYWNWGLLSLAVMGGVWLFLQGGHRRIVAVAASALFFGACTAIGFVYYINPNYANVTQLCLIVLACGVGDGVARLLAGRRGTFKAASRDETWAGRDWPVAIRSRLLRRARSVGRLGRRHLATLCVIGAVLVATGGVLLSAPAQRYLATPRAPEQWLAPETLTDSDVKTIVEAFHALPPGDAQRFEAHARKNVPASESAATEAVSRDEIVRRFAVGQLRIIRGYRTGTPMQFTVLVDRSAADAAFQAIFRSSKFILGWKANGVSGLTLTDSATWDGRTLTIVLDAKEPGGTDRSRVHALVEEKFTRRGFVRSSAVNETLTYRLPPPVTAPTAPSI